MELETIQAEARTDVGKGVARKLRASGKMPAVAYGKGGDAVSLALDPADLHNLRKGRLGWNQPLSIEVDGGDAIPLAMLRDVQRNPLTGKLLHADFIMLTEGAEIELRVPIRTVGKAHGEELGGMVSLLQRSIAVTCLPKDIPDGIDVNITRLNVGDKIMLSDLTMPSGVVVDTSVDTPVIALVGRPVEEEEEIFEGEEGEEGEEGAEGAEDAGGSEDSSDESSD
ncbi:MAG TPA: 50S ribosomal protein L25 [Deltaproteobacteria bacterium]|nr:50S ribosomal protein L25 [Deltaproteobacteria bacterium]HCP44497.1 50S ribosomal protein L25 [Deltaproteobacteria bacterium]|tara:strand:+ start:519 stop:1193 length:675 start_codon:yes stop_codon:yes gene_type:complete